MLDELNVENVGVIKSSTVAFTEGLNVLTGETGAGKTIILTALGLVLGAKADSGFIRKNCDGLTVDAVWSGLNSEASAIVSDVEGTVDDGVLNVSRIVNSSGKSKAICGGRPVPANVLSKLSEYLIAVHGQSDQVKLRNVNSQREALDSFGKDIIVEVKGRYSSKYGEYVNVKKSLKKLADNNAQLEAEKFYANSVRKDYEQHAPVRGEDVELAGKISRLSHVEELYSQTQKMLNIAGELDNMGDSVSSRLSQVSRIISELVEHDADLTNLQEVFTNVEVMFSDAINEVRNYSEGVDLDVLEELSYAHERLNTLRMLMKKYNTETCDELCDFMESYVNTADDESVSIEELEAELVSLEAEALKVGEELYNVRSKAAVELETAVNVELSGLNMVGTTLHVEHVKTNILSPHGVDSVEFMIKTPAMVSPKPMGKSASGGELSRIMLALEVVLADVEKTPTFIFDEVDSGVGGATAIEIGKRLALLAKECQVIVVTHLPQVAAFADTHFRVSKTTVDDGLVSNVAKLDTVERERELTRMFAGLEDSTSGREHAVELTEMAESFKNSH